MNAKSQNQVRTPALDASTTAFTEAEVRVMRDQVYGITCSDRNWEGCREQWMAPENINWLKDQIVLQQHRKFIFADDRQRKS